ncbi:MAG: uroporphyrinogen decarboxylase family protein, partial [Candidatus Humimicrobiaceae bacterium]
MLPKERVLLAINKKIPDRVPITNRFTPEISKKLMHILDIKSDDIFDLEVELGHDLLCTKEIGIASSYGIENNTKIGNDEYVCDFGIIKKIMNYPGGCYLEIIKNPLDEIDKYYSYKFPDPDKQETLKKEYISFENNIKKYGMTHAIVGGLTCTILEGCCMLRGLSRILMDFIENEDFLNDLMDKFVDYHFKVGRNLINLGVDVLYIGDDVGMQTAMLISPKLWRKFLKPRYSQLF